MADYSLFSFVDYSLDELAFFARGSLEVGDKEFADACIAAIKKRNPDKEGMVEKDE